LPDADSEGKHTDLSAFATEWNSPLDAAYDDLNRQLTPDSRRMTLS